VERNVRATEWVPRVAIAVGVASGALGAPKWLRIGLYGLSVAALATVATQYCPINAALMRRSDARARWTTLRTHRVQA
jgi:hypothetical protein